MEAISKGITSQDKSNNFILDSRLQIVTNEPKYFDTYLAVQHIYAYQIQKLRVFIYINFVEFKITWSENPKQAFYYGNNLKRNKKLIQIKRFILN